MGNFTERRVIDGDGNVDLNLRDKYGMTVLTHALFSHACPDTLDVLVKAGAKL